MLHVFHIRDMVWLCVFVVIDVCWMFKDIIESYGISPPSLLDILFTTCYIMYLTTVSWNFGMPILQHYHCSFYCRNNGRCCDSVAECQAERVCLDVLREYIHILSPLLWNGFACDLVSFDAQVYHFLQVLDGVVIAPVQTCIVKCAAMYMYCISYTNFWV